MAPVDAGMWLQRLWLSEASLGYVSKPGGRGWRVENVLDSETWEVLAGNEQTEILAPFSPGFAGEKGWG